MNLQKNNTFGDYQFEDWVPIEVQEMIINFWGQMGRTYEHWLKGSHEDSQFCHHGPGPNGFQVPPYGVTCEFFIKNWELSRSEGYDVYRVVRGRYIHRWNGMGSLVVSDKNTKEYVEYVSTCDRWVRVFTTKEEKVKTLNNN